MVVLSAAILSKSKVLVARQFVEITRLRIEGLLSAFTKLIEHGGKDHTYIETESVRYVYQPMENLYLLLVTNKQSNILEDLDTLRLLAQIVQDVCQVTLSDDLIMRNAFDIVFSFDEVISFGYRESVTLSQIKTYTEMDSHEEKLQAIIRQSKENEEKERRKQIASRLDKERAKQRKEDKLRAAVSSGRNAGGGAAVDEIEATTVVVGSGGSEGLLSSSMIQQTPAVEIGGHADMSGSAPRKGMQIGKKKPAVELLSSLLPKPSSGGMVDDDGEGGNNS
eukprot:GHVS01077741.1.p1 GENE.GHVS01077741.1~~GHVS01077741.1.p1  ORF type:complete len:279 (+),score=56.43 GHVS01077741.1:119-955(+)